MLYFLMLLINIYIEQPKPLTAESQVVHNLIVVGEQPQLSFEVSTLEKSSDLYSEEEIRLIAAVTIAEAEGEPEEGQRLVIDTILNRVDSSYFPDTVYDVIYQKNQFSCMWDGRFERIESTAEMCELVRKEILSRLDSDVIFFTAGQYSRYGIPLYQVGNHYFSSYE